MSGHHQQRPFKTLGFGREPAVLVIDYQVAFTDPERSPIAGDYSPQIEKTSWILEVARRTGVPTFLTAIVYEDDLRDAGIWAQKARYLDLLTRSSGLTDLDPRLGKTETDQVLVKKYASAFFGTTLATSLTTTGIDTLIVTGCTTSACVRATVVDALQYGFRPMVVADAVGDPDEAAHDANLADIHTKFGDVIDSQAVVEYLESRRRGE